MTNDITPEFKKTCNEHYNSMKDNSQVNDDVNKLKFVKMNVSAEHLDFLMNYYKLSNIVEVNQSAIYMLKALAHMEQDGYKFAMYKTEMKDGKEVLTTSGSFAMSVSDMINSILKQPTLQNNL